MLRENISQIKNFITEHSLGYIGILAFALFAPVSVALAQISIGITILGWILEMIKQRKILWKRTPLDIPLLIFLLTQIVAVLRADDFSLAFFSWLNTDWFILFFFAVINIIDREEEIKKIFYLLLFSGFISALYGIWQHFEGWDYLRSRALHRWGDFYRASGFFGLLLTYAAIQLSIFLLILPFIFTAMDRKVKKYIILILIIVFLSILASYARSAWLGLFGVVIFSILFSFNLRMKLYGITAIIFMIILLYFFHPALLFNNGIVSMFNFSESAPYNNLVRLKLWQSAIHLIRENWLFGVGYSNLKPYINLYKVPFDYRGLSAPHCDILHIICKSGILGGLAFLFMWLSFLKKTYVKLNTIYKKLSVWQALRLGGFLVALALLIGGFTQEYYRDAEVAQLWWFCTAMGIIGLMKNKQMTKKIK
jgi:O-antigen ligase